MSKQETPREREGGYAGGEISTKAKEQESTAHALASVRTLVRAERGLGRSRRNGLKKYIEATLLITRHLTPRMTEEQ